jgi:hypothetical protein
MDKLYHVFHVSAYKGGELHSQTNQTIENIASGVDVDWDELFERFFDDERFSNITDEEFSKMTCVQLLDMLDDETLKDIATDSFYPGNEYAFDSYSDSEVYTVNDEGKLIEVNVIEEPGFMEAFKKAIRKDAEWTDKWNKEHNG